MFTRLRQQATRAAKSKQTSSSGTTKPTQKTHAAQPSAAELKAIIGKKLQSINLNNADGLSRARKIFIETSIAWEFGDSILLDPTFAELVQKVEMDFNENPQLCEEFTVMLKGLQTHNKRIF